MNDTLDFISKDPIHRKYHHHQITFGLLYAFYENFILPLSHDEVVHGKRSILGRMPGDDWQRFANVRAYYGFMFGHPGKKLLFMGSEFAQEREWQHDHSLDWHLLEKPQHAGVQALVRDLNALYRSVPALHALDCEGSGFEWLVLDDVDNSVFAWMRKGRDDRERCLVVVNFTPQLHRDYRIPVPFAGRWREVLNTDAAIYGGSNAGNAGAAVSFGEPRAARPATCRSAVGGDLPRAGALTCVFRPARLFRSGRPSTAAGPTSRCSPRMPRRSSSACSTPAGRERERVALPERTNDVWHGYLADVGAGPALRLPRPWTLRARAGPSLQSQQAAAGPVCKGARRASHPERSALRLSLRQSARGLVFRPARQRSGHAEGGGGFAIIAHHEPEGGRCVAWENTIIYEAHVKGLTRLRRDIPPKLCGTFAALAEPAMIAHLKRLGVTALELLPIHTFIDEPFLKARGLTNYWGYNTLNFFTADPRYGTWDAVRTTVDRLHDAGIEVILDVVYNHTAEGDHLGRTLSFRGIDNASYYWLKPKQPRYYENFTGCGNALNLSHPMVAAMVIDSLRHWVEAAGVDGFRFDLATTLARGPHGFDDRAPFLQAIADDPVLTSVKIDCGAMGYRARRLSCRRVSAGVVGMERRLSPLAAPLLERGGQPDRRGGDADDRLRRHLRAPSPHAACEHQPHHRARRLHACRSCQL